MKLLSWWTLFTLPFVTLIVIMKFVLYVILRGRGLEANDSSFWPGFWRYSLSLRTMMSDVRMIIELERDPRLEIMHRMSALHPR